MGKIIVGKTSEIPPGKIIKVSISGKEIMVVNIEGEFFAMDDSCTHSGASLSEGKLEGSVVNCGWHGAQFDCKSGKLVKFPAKIRDLVIYKVEVESGNLFVNL